VTRLALLTEIPAPYRIPLFNALAERLDLTVLFLRERNPERLHYRLHAEELRFRWEILPGRDLTIRGRWLVVNGGVVPRLRGADAVLLGGWNQPAFWTALAWSRAHRMPAILWVESTGRDQRSGRLERAKRRLLSIPRGLIVPGSASREYLRRLGVAESRITVAPNAVDSAIFASAERTRAEGPCRLLTVGRLAHEKGVDTLLRAAEGLPVEVLVAGTGPEEPRLRAMAGGQVRFLGEVERDALPALYADADVLVMPSRSDPWGMVLNEAALAGLPLVSTDAAGAAHDLIEHGVNGFRVPPDDVPALREALQRLCGDAGFRRAAGDRSRALAARFSPDAWADSVAALVTRLAAA
jgi:glycosyltransferase involved in cell wall biosynthesis